jgi:hypothetical protein
LNEKIVANKPCPHCHGRLICCLPRMLRTWRRLGRTSERLRYAVRVGTRKQSLARTIRRVVAASQRSLKPSPCHTFQPCRTICLGKTRGTVFQADDRRRDRRHAGVGRWLDRSRRRSAEWPRQPSSAIRSAGRSPDRMGTKGVLPMLLPLPTFLTSCADRRSG